MADPFDLKGSFFEIFHLNVETSVNVVGFVDLWEQVRACIGQRILGLRGQTIHMDL
jgi:hypothetical protein